MNMLLKDMAKYVKEGDEHWEKWMGKEYSYMLLRNMRIYPGVAERHLMQFLA